MIYSIRDPIYGFIGFSDWERQVINHPSFQRLRHIQQLGITSLVYPSAVHTRFEHSLGVMHLATLMFDKVKEKNHDLLKKKGYCDKELSREKQVIRFAGLLHDVGHAPFSHVCEELLPPINGKKVGHEEYSARIINEKLKKSIEEHKDNKKWKIKAEEIAACITEIPQQKSSPLKLLISGQLDADRGDYLLRDSYHAGVKYGVYDYHRILDTLSLAINPEEDDLVLGLEGAGLYVAESFIIARYQIFNQIYFHKTRRAFEFHLRRAMKALIGKLPPLDKIDKFIGYNDSIVWDKIMSNPKNPDCKAILERSHIREVYKSSDALNEDEINFIDEAEKQLETAGIWFHHDDSKNDWYKDLNEIFIIEGKSITPLLKKSNLVKKLEKLKKIRIFAQEKDREKAKTLISQIKKK